MTTAQTQWADISALDYYRQISEGSVFTLRAENVLVRTVTVFSDMSGMNLRKLHTVGSANVRSLAEGEDMAPTYFDKDLTSTLTPARHGDQFLLTDERITSDWENVRVQAAQELGSNAANYVDTLIAGLFSSLTGGTIGAALGTVNWSNIAQAKGKLRQAKVPGPYFCVLGEGMWYHLVNNAGTTSVSFTYYQQFSGDLIANYYISSIMGDVIFAPSANVSGNGGGTCTGAMYSPRALAYDERDPFSIEPQRDASKGATELNVNMRFAYGTWLPLRGVQILGTDVIPTS